MQPADILHTRDLLQSYLHLAAGRNDPAVHENPLPLSAMSV
jgi:hypothetical protein